jgi:hypothetical protein
MMYDYFEAAIAVDRIGAALSKIEYEVYRLDEVYQDEVIPVLVQGAVLGLEAIAQFCILFWKVSIWTLVLGQRVNDWFLNWMADYCNPFPLICTDVDVTPTGALLPDPWFETVPLFHTPPVYGTVWNPPVRDVHFEVQRMLVLQTVPLMLAPAKVKRNKKRK